MKIEAMDSDVEKTLAFIKANVDQGKQLYVAKWVHQLAGFVFTDPSSKPALVMSPGKTAAQAGDFIRGEIPADYGQGSQMVQAETKAPAKQQPAYNSDSDKYLSSPLSNKKTLKIAELIPGYPVVIQTKEGSLVAIFNPEEFGEITTRHSKYDVITIPGNIVEYIKKTFPPEMIPKLI